MSVGYLQVFQKLFLKMKKKLPFFKRQPTTNT